MHKELFLGAWLLAAPMAALAAADTAEPVAAVARADDMVQMNAVSQAWDRYVELSLKDDPAAAEAIAPSSLRHFVFLRDVARAGSADQLRRLPISDRAIVYALRATQTPEQLAALDGAGVARISFSRGWSGPSTPQEGQPTPRLTHVTVLSDDLAVGEVLPPNGAQFNFGPEFARDDGRWKVVTQSTTADEAAYLAQLIKQSAQTETQVMQNIVARFVGADSAPNLAMLDAPPVDDAALRTRINETWPDYTATYRTRIRAVERKAVDGDVLAQFAMGTLLYSGESPQLVKQDKARGLTLLEQASNAGDARAAMVMVAALMDASELPKNAPYPADRLKRTLPHLRRAAENGIPLAMSGLGDFYFNGAGGLPRDCTQAEEWAARAEDAGWEHARNNRIWALAACPIQAQRNPARALELAATLISRADELESSELDTIAATYAANHRFTEAVDFQKRALARLEADDDATRHRMKERLKAYQGKLDWTQTYSVFERR